MSVRTTDVRHNSSTFPDNVYILNQVTVCDKTNGIAEVILSRGNHIATYQVFVNNKKLIFPTSSFPERDEGLAFRGSLKINFEKEDRFIKITEINLTNTSIFYVDPEKDAEGVAYDVYSYIPRQITLEEAKKKIQNIKKDYPGFTGELAVYNRHGVAVFGWYNDTGVYSLCWAKPSEEKAHMVDCFSVDRERNGGSCSAKASNGQVNFRHKVGHGYYLNAEVANLIKLT